MPGEQTEPTTDTDVPEVGAQIDLAVAPMRVPPPMTPEEHEHGN